MLVMCSRALAHDAVQGEAQLEPMGELALPFNRYAQVIIREIYVHEPAYR